MKELLQEREEWRKKLEELKSQKNELIKKGVITEEYYQQRYEEIMDRLVDIEDKIIQEKVRGGIKPEGPEDKTKELEKEIRDSKQAVTKDQSKTKNKRFIAMLALIIIVGGIIGGSYLLWPMGEEITPSQDTERLPTTTLAPTTTAAPTTEKPAGSTVKNSDTIVKYTVGDARNLDPADAYDDFSYEILFQIYDRLVTYKGTDTTMFYPQLATDWNVSEDGKLWTFHLRKGVKFSNGSDFTAEDVVYSFGRALTMNSPDSGVSWILDQFLEVGDTVVVDDYTVEFQLEEPCGYLLSCLALPLCSIVDKEYIEAHGGFEADIENEFMKENPMGTGPYMLDHWTRKREIKLVKNPTYWGGWEGKHVSNVIIKMVDETSTRISALENGNADFAYIPTANIDDVKGAPGVRFTTGYSPVIVTGHFQTKSLNKFMTDPLVRQAFCYAFDYDSAIRDIYNGWAFRISGSIPKGFLCYDTQSIVYNFDPDKAAALLDRAGYTKNKNGYRFNGVAVRIYYNEGNEERTEMAQMLQRNLRKIGVNSQAISENWPQYLSRIFSTTDWDITFLGWSPDYIDPDNYILYFIGSANIGEDVWNTGWANAEVDDLLMEARKEVDQVKRCEMYGEAWEINIVDPNLIFVCQQMHTHFEREWVHGYTYNPCIPWYYYNYYKE